MPANKSLAAALSINPGDLRHLITIQAPSSTAGAMGNSLVPGSWTQALATWAAIYTPGAGGIRGGGRFGAQGDQIISEATHVVKIRWTPVTLAAGYQVLFGTRVFTINYIENLLERNRVLLLYCKEIDGQQ